MSRRIAVLGTGYLGVTHAACMAELGFEVLGMDCRPGEGGRAVGRRGAVLRAGPRAAGAPSTLATGRLRFTTSYAEVAEFGDVHFTCVGHPATPRVSWPRTCPRSTP